MLQLCIETASKTLYHTGLIHVQVHLCVGMRTHIHTLLNVTPLSCFIHLVLKSYENGAQQSSVKATTGGMCMYLWYYHRVHNIFKSMVHAFAIKFN